MLYTRRCYPNFPAASRDELALHAFLVQAERAEVELCCRHCGASVDAAGAALPLGTKNVGVQSRQRKDPVRTATLPATETAGAAHALWLHDGADLELQQCRQLGLVEDCRWTGQSA